MELRYKMLPTNRS